MSDRTDSTQPPWHWIIEQATVVALDGSTLPDPETGQPRTAIVVKMPAFVAEHLAAVLVAWSQLSQIVDAWSGEETETASTLLAAAQVARRQDDGRIS
ncbi:MAG TPA: hypothetical protein VGX03_13415 [Candidatus Binatia bacterium]|jgi:hypothetical protein|nr:hypothetical protein [Candidatus Binatia bacterium]